MLVALAAVIFVAWADFVRVRRAEYTTDHFVEPPATDAASPTGYVGGARQLIVPSFNEASYHWIAQTQQMLAQNEWRVRHVDYDNAPTGRAVESSSPYRWWLGLVAGFDHLISGRPLGQSVEHAALWADPVLHLLFLVGTAIFIARWFGPFPAALFSAAVATAFPFAAGFVPAVPDEKGLALVCAIWSLLPLLVGLRALSPPASPITEAPPRRWFLIAGVLGGFGLWVSVAIQVPVIMGIAVGGLLAAIAARRNPADGNALARAWWAWATGGAATTLLAYLVEYFPAHLGSWQLRAVHPLYGLAWLGLGAILSPATLLFQSGKSPGRVRAWLILLFGLVALAVLPVAMWKLKTEGFLAGGVAAFRLSKLPGDAVAANLWVWMVHDGITAKLWTTFLPVLLLIPAGWIIFRRRTSPGTRIAVAVTLGPVLVALGFAGRGLNGWGLLDAMLLVLLVAVTTDAPAQSRIVRGAWSVCTAAILILGVIQLVPSTAIGAKMVLSEPELVGLIERDMARWLAKRTGPGVGMVLAPPTETTALCYFGGLRGLGTLAWENQEGIGAAIRIASASTPEEAKELIDHRGVTDIVVPSWDSSLDDYARAGMGQVEGTFISRLHVWRLPPWLRPVPYRMPIVSGFEGQQVRVFELVEDQGDALSLSRTAEYFVEMEQLDLAGAVAQALRRFPGDLGAWVARVDVEAAQGGDISQLESFKQLLPRVKTAASRPLPLDQRVNLAVLLVRGKQLDLAREQLRRCLEQLDETGLRSLTTGSLYRFQVLLKALGLEIAPPKLRQLALDLLPPEMRSRL
jgi:hypothetical protein